MEILHKEINIENVSIFYREAGNKAKQTILLLHGFPSSSHMFRNIMKELSNDYHLIAPDYPGFGNSSTPSPSEFEYTFDNLADITEKFIDQLNLSNIHLLVQDYGGPIGFRIAQKRPELIQGLIIQNANAYFEGIGEYPKKIKGYIEQEDFAGLTDFKNHLFSLEGIKSQYIHGTENPEKIDPSSYLTDHYFMQREGITAIQHALFDNYGTNFPKYAEWQTYFKEHQPKTLIIWGENDFFFTKEGAEAYKNDLKNVESHFFNSGHFMLEEHYAESAQLIDNFINK